MDEVLIVGFSDIVRRRVLPALHGIAQVRSIHLCSAAAPGEVNGVTSIHGDLEHALAAHPGALVYVSGTNEAHAARVLAALEAGHHVVVDKPAFLTEAAGRLCIDAARAGSLLLAEAIVWPWHAQVIALTDRMAEQGLTATSIEAQFTIPALPPGNFRTRPELGGGASADMGVYAMSPARIFGSGDLLGLSAEVLERSPDGLDLAFAVQARYSDGLDLLGSFSLDSTYSNRLRIAGDGWSARLEPAFSSQPDAVLTVELEVQGRALTFDAGPSNAFEEFLRAVLSAVDTGDFERLSGRTEESIADQLRLGTALGIQRPADTGFH